MRALFCVLALSVVAAPVGMESTLTLQSAERLQVLPVDTERPLLVRVIEERQQAAGWEYELGVVGQFPGEFPMAEYLATFDGRRPGLTTVVAVTGVLPDDHNGWLDPMVGADLPRSHYYSRWWTAAWILWALGLVYLLRPKTAEEEALPEAPTPTMAERLIAILEGATAADLSPRELQRIEVLVRQLWCEHLGLSAEEPGTALASLKAHPQSGPIIQDLERCLHAPSTWDAARFDAIVRASLEQEAA